MKLHLLPSTIGASGKASTRQHLLSIIIDDRVAIDAGSLAMACTDIQRTQVRDVVLTHTHLDHIAGLPLFIDDLFGTLTEPLRVHATQQMIDVLERDVFNWAIYPKFSELRNGNGPVIKYCPFAPGATFTAGHLSIESIPVNHTVSANGFLISDGRGTVAITGDTAETDEFWQLCNATADLKAVLVECAFPDEYSELAYASAHLIPSRLVSELTKLDRPETPVFVINMKPMYRDTIVREIEAHGRPNLSILEVGRVYEF